MLILIVCNKFGKIFSGWLSRSHVMKPGVLLVLFAELESRNKQRLNTWSVVYIYIQVYSIFIEKTSEANSAMINHKATYPS